MSYVSEIYDTIVDVTRSLGEEIDTSKIQIIDRGFPHLPKSLMPGKMGVYVFIYGDQFLKIGKAGPMSKARFLSHHYNPHSSLSNLAASILMDMEMALLGITGNTVGSWIKTNCRRIDIFLDISLGYFTLELVEAILHYKYKPKYEGFVSQRDL